MTLSASAAAVETLALASSLKADFDQSYEPINGNEAGAGRYTVRAGDTLRTIARQVWGDESLWWMIADANGLDGASELAEGMNLVIPNKVANVHNNAETFKPYDLSLPKIPVTS